MLVFEKKSWIKVSTTDEIIVEDILRSLWEYHTVYQIHLFRMISGILDCGWMTVIITKQDIHTRYIHQYLHRDNCRIWLVLIALLLRLLCAIRKPLAPGLTLKCFYSEARNRSNWNSHDFCLVKSILRLSNWWVLL